MICLFLAETFFGCCLNFNNDEIKTQFDRKVSHHNILNISKTSSKDEIKKAYKQLMKQYHPDKVMTENSSVKKEFEEKAKLINEAYQTLIKA